MKVWPLFGSLLVCSSLCALADEPARPAWQYSDTERLDRRFDLRSIRERASRDATEPYGMSVSTNAASPSETLPNVIIGRRNPELFMPHELFMELVQASILEERRTEFRSRLSPLIAPLLDPNTFWSRFEAATAPYTALLKRERDFALRLQNASPTDRAELLRHIEIVQEPQCAARADALQQAAMAIGRETLFRVLYEGIAPTMAIRSGPQLDADQLKFIAGGCR